jgi:hypothetical protein
MKFFEFLFGAFSDFFLDWRRSDIVLPFWIFYILPAFFDRNTIPIVFSSALTEFCFG